MRQKYVDHNFRASTIRRINEVEEILDEYQSQGYSVSLRQLYYVMVSRGTIQNKQTEYDNLGVLIVKAKEAGYIDWNIIEDRTRWMRRPSTWDSPADIIDSALASFAIDLWVGQTYRVVVAVEKDALVDVVGRPASALQVPYMSTRGYASSVAVHNDLKAYIMRNKRIHDAVTVIVHIADHDPSGIDMSRDIEDRLYRYDTPDHYYKFVRLALNFDQVKAYNPPPNPAKMTDPRALNYIEEHGKISWEADALTPDVFHQLITEEILRWRQDEGAWERREKQQEMYKAELEALSKNYSDVANFMNDYGLVNYPESDDHEEDYE